MESGVVGADLEVIANHLRITQISEREICHKSGHRSLDGKDTRKWVLWGKRDRVK